MSTSIARAVTILGPGNVHGVLDVERQFKWLYTERELATLREIPFSEGILEDCCDTHLLIAGARLSLLDIRDRHPTLFSHCKPAWYDQAAEKGWADEEVVLRWYLLRKEPVPGSRGKTYAEQCALLRSEDVSRPGEVAYGVILHYLMTGEHLLSDAWTRTTERGAIGYRVAVGGFDRDGLSIDFVWDDYRGALVGLAAVRKC